MGTIRQMKLVSNNIGYGPMPDCEDEVEQHLSISADGGVSFSAFCYGDGEPYEESRHLRCSVAPETAKRVLDLIDGYFCENTVRFDVTDVGEWTLTLIYEDGRTEKHEGPLCDGYEWNGQNLSNALRQALQMPDLIAFDDCGAGASIDRITLDFHRVKLMEAGQAFGPEVDHISIDTTERLLIDRATDTIEICRKMGLGMEIRHSYHIQEGVGSFLDEFEDDLFRFIPPTPAEAKEDPLDVRNYTLLVELSNGGRVEQRGYYDKFGVPYDLEYFLDGLLEFLEFYGIAEFFSRELLRKSNRMPASKLIFCSCAFKRGGQTYYYLTEDTSLKVGDLVWVTAGKGNHEKVVRIEAIEICDADDPPFDPYSTKHILRLCEDDEIPEVWLPPTPFFCPLIERVVTADECEAICHVVAGSRDKSTLEQFDPPIEIDLSKDAICWQCDNGWL